MSKYRKGRVLVLASMVGFSSITVLAGTAAPESYKDGKIDVSSTSKFPKVKGKMKNVLPTACIFIKTSKFRVDGHGKGTLDLSATFKGRGPIDHNSTTVDTQYDGVEITPNGINTFDLTSFLANVNVKGKNKKLEKKGYHVEVTIGKRHKSFWVWASGAGIGCPTRNADGTVTPPTPADDWATAPATIPECSTDTFVASTWVPSNGSTLAFGSTSLTDAQPVTVEYNNPGSLNADTAEITLDNAADPLETSVTTADDGLALVGATLPAFTDPGVSHTVTAYAEDNNGDCAESTVSFMTPSIGNG